MLPYPSSMALSTVALLALLAGCGRRAPEQRQADTQRPDALASEPAVQGGAYVTLTPASVRTAGIETMVARAADIQGFGITTVPGRVEVEPGRQAVVTPRVAGRLERLLAAVGDRVSQGQVVAEVFSREYANAQSDLAQAGRRANVLHGTPDEADALVLVEAARRRFLLAGGDRAEADVLVAGGDSQPFLRVRAPFAGSLVEAGALPGSAVESGAVLFRIVDLREVDVIADVPEAQLGQLRRGQRATVTIAAFPDLRFGGTVERIRDELDPTTRTVGAVLHVPNRNGLLRPGMFATVALSVPAPSSAESVIVVPESAVLAEGDRRIAFVETALRRYERRDVIVESVAAPSETPPERRQMRVRSGIVAGERVVVRGAFTLKSELAKAAFAEKE